MNRTQREAALASLKGLQDKLQKSGGLSAIPADQLNSMFGELIDTVKTLAGAPAPGSLALPARKMSFGRPYGDDVYRRAEFVDALPKDVQLALDECFIISNMTRQPVQNLKSWNRLMEGSNEFQKALDTAESGGGADWIPTGFSSELIREVTALAGVEQMHRHITMPTNPYKVPLQLGRLTVYKVSEQTADTGQTAGTKSSGAGATGALTLTAAGIQGEVLTSKNLAEDSIVAIMPFLREEIVMALARGIEEACINGDTTGSHQDSDVTGSDDRRKLWKGYRKHALENSYSVDFAGAGNAFDWETMNKVRAQLGKYGTNPADLFWLCSLNLFFKLLSLKDNAGNAIVTTADKFPQATIVTGQLGAFGGSAILASEFMRDDLNSSGVYASGSTKTALACVQKSGFVFGDRRDTTMQVLSELYAEYQQDALLITMRKDFQPVRPIATNKAVALGYNITA